MVTAIFKKIRWSFMGSGTYNGHSHIQEDKMVIYGVRNIQWSQPYSRR